MSETQLKQRIIQKLESMGQDTLVFLDRFIDSLTIFHLMVWSDKIGLQILTVPVGNLKLLNWKFFKVRVP